MASIYKPHGRSRYYIAYRDPGTKRRVIVPGYVDREATAALATDIQRVAARRAAGIEPPVRVVPSLEDHLAYLRGMGRDATWVRTIGQRIGKARDAVPSLDPQKLAAWIAETCVSPKTAKQYRGILSRYIGVAVPDLGFAGGESRAARRALTQDEASRLLAAAPSYRRIVYLVAMTTGLRRKELRRLEWRDVGTRHLALRDAATKSRRADVLPLREDVAAELEAMRQESGLVFPRVPRSDTLRLDLANARIVTPDASGRVVNMHSLRYTFCTMLAMAGVSLYEAMTLMRHRDIRLTTRIYMDAGCLDTRSAVDKLPALTRVLR